MSGNAGLSYKKSELVVSKNSIPFRGTFVKASIKYSVDKLLEKALIFKGKIHNPGYDYVERVYQIKGTDIKFNVHTELDAFGSRDAGRFARNKILNLMDNGTASIQLDFTNIGLISSSFADECFGKLFLDLGPIKFGQLCKFKNVDPTVRGLVDRAISQRMRQYRNGIGRGHARTMEATSATFQTRSCVLAA